MADQHPVMGGERPEKRQRLTSSEDDDSSKVNVLSPDNVASSSGSPAAATAGGVTPPIISESTPVYSPEELCRALGIITDEKKYSGREKFVAMIWIVERVDEKGRDMMKDFFDYGGPARLVIFLKENMSDQKCVILATQMMSDSMTITSEDMELMTRMRLAFAKRNAVNVLLLANEEEFDCKLTKRNIWGTIGNLVFGQVYPVETKMDVVEAALDTMMNCTRESSEHASKLLKILFAAIRNSIFGDGRVSPQQLKDRNLLRRCVDAVWDGSKVKHQSADLLCNAPTIFWCCATEKADFELVIPVVVETMNLRFANGRTLGYSLRLLNSSISKGVERSFLEKTGVVSSLGAILKSTDQDRIRTAVGALMKKIYSG